MAHHIFQVSDAALPTTTEHDGTVRAATDSELRNHGLIRIGTEPVTGDGIYTIPCVDPCDERHPGVELSRGFLNERHQALPSRLKPHVFRADVFRATRDGVNLRELLESDLGKTILPEELAPADVRAEAARRTEGDNPSVERRRPTMADIQDGDIVDREDIYPMRMAGEISSR